mmetsp:Transcript_13944/g.39671  ORF Transcript_13944/g.39671 Transcript_13944/m.39671 type:complete len:642 (-) Transcript_13944:2916-4841(-)
MLTKEIATIENLIRVLKGTFLFSSNDSIIPTLQRRMGIEDSGSLIVPSPLSIEQQQQLNNDHFQIQFKNCSIHWSWEDTFCNADDSSSSSTCLLTLLSTSGGIDFLTAINKTETTKNNNNKTNITFQGFQLTLESSHQHNTTIKSFYKFDAIHGFDRIWHNFRITCNNDNELQVSCPLMNISTPNTNNNPKNNIFLAKFLSWLHTFGTPNATTIQSPSACTLQIDKDNSTMYVPLFPDYHQNENENANASSTRATVTTVIPNSASNHNNTQTQTTDPIHELNGGIQTLGDIFRIYYNASQDGLNASTKKSRENNNNRFQRFKQSVSDSLAVTAGCVATGASFVTPVGAAMSVATIALKDTIVDASKKGAETRMEQSGDADNKDGGRYKFGDITRGISTKIKERQERSERKLGSVRSETTGEFETNVDPQTATENEQLSQELLEKDQEADMKAKQVQKERNSRYTGVVGSSVGAAAGMAIAGPVGLVAGSLLGSVAGSRSVAVDDDDEAKKPPEPTISADVLYGTNKPPAKAFANHAVADDTNKPPAEAFADHAIPADNTPPANTNKTPPAIPTDNTPVPAAAANNNKSNMTAAGIAGASVAAVAGLTVALPVGIVAGAAVAAASANYKFGDFTRGLLGKKN